MRVRHVESNQFVDSIVRPDIISIANSASRRKMKEDVRALVMKASIAKEATTRRMKGVKKIQPIAETINVIIIFSKFLTCKVELKKEKLIIE